MYFVARNLYLALATFNFARGGVCGESLLSQESLLCAGKFSLQQEEVFTGSLYPAISHYLRRQIFTCAGGGVYGESLLGHDGEVPADLLHVRHQPLCPGH